MGGGRGGGVPSLVIDAKVLESGQAFPRFPECATEIGIDVDDIAGGAILDDFTNDGALDVLLSSWSGRGQLRFFVNGGDGALRGVDRGGGAPGHHGRPEHGPGRLPQRRLPRRLYRAGRLARRGGEKPRFAPEEQRGRDVSDRTESSGLLSYSPALSAVWADITNDGWVDLLVGQETSSPIPFPLELYVNRGDGTFVECAKPSGLAVTGFTRGVIAGDVDNDGWVDIYVSRLGQPNLLFRNPGSPNKWLALSVAGTRSNRAAIGARVKVVVEDADGSERAIHRVVGSGGSFGASTFRVEVGLGDLRRIKEVEVRWPGSGKTERGMRWGGSWHDSLEGVDR